MSADTSLSALRNNWSAAWQRALSVWSRFTRLSEPIWCMSDEDAAKEGLTESFAMIRFVDQAVVINLKQAQKLGLDGYPVEILAHEIGHHILAPANLDDHARCIARMRWALPTLETHAGMVANLYTDLLINDRLKRSEKLRMDEVYIQLGAKTNSRLWNLYMRIYEILWSLQKGTLTSLKMDDQLEGDALLGARVVRVYARDWLEGAGRFAALVLPYLLQDTQEAAQRMQTWHDTRDAGKGGIPNGLVDVDDAEQSGAIHPANDPALNGLGDAPETREPAPTTPDQNPSTPKTSGGQKREPYQYGEILRAMGVNLNDHEIAVKYYRERAAPYLIKFPAKEIPESAEPLPEGLEPWEIGDPLDNADWFESVLRSPRVVPGVTTFQRVYGTTQGSLPERQPLHLDLYVDCSGSMPNPQKQTSFLTLAGAIIALSALRAGARVQATLWSGKQQFKSTDGFVRDETEVLRILTGYYGGSTQFPIHILRETYANRRPTDAPVHIFHISDDGISTMFETDDKKNSGWDVAALALKKARGGGTMVLNLPADWETRNNPKYAYNPYPIIVKAKNGQGWDVNRIGTWEELVAFARRFSQKTYEDWTYAKTLV